VAKQQIAGITPKVRFGAFGLPMDGQRRGGPTSCVVSGAQVDITRKVITHQPDRSLFANFCTSGSRHGG